MQISDPRRFNIKRIAALALTAPMPEINGPGIGMVPPEFDDIEGGEKETLDDLRANFLSP